MPEAERPWPADRVERRPVDSLVPYARNSRTHSPAQVDKLAASMREWGVTTPVLIDEDGTIIAGHARVLAARKLGLDELPVMVASGWTEAQRRAYVIADNRLPLDSEWDGTMLSLELESLRLDGFDTLLTGFSTTEVETSLGDPVSTDDPATLWQGMPEFTHEDKTSFAKAIVHFRNADDKADFERLIGQRIPDNTKAVWHPAENRDSPSALRYASDDA